MNVNTLIDLFADEDEEEYIQLLQQAQQSLTHVAESMSAPGAHGGSHPGRSPNIDRQSQTGHERIIKDYFAERPIYGDKLFRRRFRMRRPLFMKIVTPLKPTTLISSKGRMHLENLAFQRFRKQRQPFVSWLMAHLQMPSTSISGSPKVLP